MNRQHLRLLSLLFLGAIWTSTVTGAYAAVQAEYFSWTGFANPATPAAAPLRPYVSGGDTVVQRVTVTEGNIDRNFDSNPPNLPNIGNDNFAVRWRGMVNIPASGSWTFYVTSDDGIRLWIDQGLLTGQWIDRGAATDSAAITLSAGLHDVTVEYYERGGGAVAQLEWSGPGVGRQIVPASSLSLPPENGLNGRYITNSTNPLDSPTITRYDYQIRFPWDTQSPDNSVSAENFTARWVGKVLAPTTGTYNFIMRTDDGNELWVNGTRILNNINTATAPADFTSSPITLTGGQYYSIDARFREQTGGAHCELRWVGPGIADQLVPEWMLFTAMNQAPTNIVPSDTNIDENQAINAVVCTLATTDTDNPTGAPPHVYTIVGGADAASFNINGTELRANATFNFEAKSSYQVTLRSTDVSSVDPSPYYDKTFTISVNNINETPTDITPSDTNVDENAGANAVVCTLSTTDPDNPGANQSHVYTIVGGADAALFNTNSNELRLNNNVDFETKSTLEVRVRTTDNSAPQTPPSLWYEETLVISVNNVNEAPTDIVPSDTNVDENAGANAVVCTLSTTDPDNPGAGQTHAYSIVGGADAALLNINGPELRLNNSVDFETKPTLEVRIRTTDSGSPQTPPSLWYEETLSISVNNINETPTDIVPSDTSVDENAGANAVVCTLSTTDPDNPGANQSHVYTIVGGADAALFNINGNELRLNNSVDFETQPTLEIRIRTTDNSPPQTPPSLWYEKTLTIAVNDLDEVPPSITNVTSSLANGYYRAGQIVPIQVTFSEPVFVAGGTPTLALNSGGAANYNSGSGGATLTFNYTVSAGQNAPDLDYTGIGALALGSATIRDAAGNDAVTALPSPGAPGSLGANKDLAIDTSPPTATAITSVTPNPTNGTTVTFSVTFNEPVQQFNDTNDLVITKTGSVAHAGVTIAGGPAVYTVSLTGVTGEGTVKLAVRVTSPGDVKDLAGNALWSSVTSADVRIDRTNPSVTVASLITKDPTPTLSGTVSDNVGVAGVTVVVAGHSYAAVVAGGAWTADVTDPLPDGTHDVQATAADTAGNTAVDATADELVIDQTPPVVTVASRMTNDTTPTISGTVSDNRGVSGVTVTVNGQTYPADVAGNAWTAEVTHALAEGVYDVLATATDTVGNIGTDATTDELAIDFNVPSVTVDFLATNDPTPTVTGTAAAQPGHVINSVSVVVNGVAYPYTPAPPSNTVNWSVTTGALLDGTYDVLATATDDVSRTGGDGTVDELVVDTQSPAAVLARAGASETGADAVVFNVTFNEPVSPTFGLGDVTVTGSLSGAVSVGGADPNYTVTVTLDEPDTDGTVGIVVGGDVTDAAGNPYAGGASPLYGIYNWRGFLLEPSSRKAYEGVSHTFEVAPDCGATTIAYLWKWDDGSKTIYDGPAAPVWTFESLNASNAGTYWCELTYDGETHATAQATLAVAAPLTILQQPAGGQAPVGGSFTFTVSARGGYEPLAYQWLKNGYPIGGATQPIYSIGVLATTDSGSYTVSITDDNTAVLVSEAAVLTVTGGAMPAAGLAGLAALALALGGLGVIRRRKE